MDRFDAMRIFARVAQRRSFMRAADDLGLPRSTITDAVKQLERRLGVILLQRTTRHVAPTLDGEAYLRRCLAILADVEEAEGAFAGAKPKGLLRVDVHGTLARHFVLPHLPKFLDAYPDLVFRMSEGDRFADLIREGIDCVLRVGAPPDSDMIVRRVAMLEEATLASPGYVARYGLPQRIEALADGHRMIGFHSTATGGVLPLEFTVGGAVREVVLPSTVIVNAAESYVAAAQLGFGLIQAPRYHVAAALRAGELVEILPDHPPTPTLASLLYPRSRQLSPRVRVFADWLIEEFAAANRQSSELFA